MRVALCQLPISPDPATNLGRVAQAVASAAGQGADLAVFPEATLARFGSDLRGLAEPLDGEFGTGLAQLARDSGMALVVGVFEPAPDGRVYNTAVAYSGAGDLVAAYRKIHMFDSLGERESALVAPGSEPVVADLAGIRTGFATCYDIRFPTDSRSGGPRRRADRRAHCLGRRAVQGGALGHPGPGPRDREHGLGRGGRSGSRPRLPSHPRADRCRPQHAGRSDGDRPGRPRAVAAGDCGRTGQRTDRPDEGGAAVPGAPARRRIWPADPAAAAGLAGPTGGPVSGSAPATERDAARSR